MTLSDDARRSLAASFIVLYDRGTASRLAASRVFRPLVKKLAVCQESRNVVALLARYNSPRTTGGGASAVNAVVMDLDIAAVKLAQHLRSTHATPAGQHQPLVPIIVVVDSDDPRPELLAAALEAGVDSAALRRPYDQQAIIATVGEVLRRQAVIEAGYADIIDATGKESIARYPRFKLYNVPLQGMSGGSGSHGANDSSQMHQQHNTSVDEGVRFYVAGRRSTLAAHQASVIGAAAALLRTTSHVSAAAGGGGGRNASMKMNSQLSIRDTVRTFAGGAAGDATLPTSGNGRPNSFRRTESSALAAQSSSPAPEVPLVDPLQRPRLYQAVVRAPSRAGAALKDVSGAKLTSGRPATTASVLRAYRGDSSSVAFTTSGTGAAAAGGVGKQADEGRAALELSAQMRPFVRRKRPEGSVPKTSAGLDRALADQTVRLVQATFAYSRGQRQPPPRSPAAAAGPMVEQASAEALAAHQEKRTRRQVNVLKHIVKDEDNPLGSVSTRQLHAALDVRKRADVRLDQAKEPEAAGGNSGSGQQDQQPSQAEAGSRKEQQQSVVSSSSSGAVDKKMPTRSEGAAARWSWAVGRITAIRSNNGGLGGAAFNSPIPAAAAARRGADNRDLFAVALSKLAKQRLRRGLAAMRCPARDLLAQDYVIIEPPRQVSTPAGCLLQQGWQRQTVGDWAGAARQYRRALVEEPRNLMALFCAGVAAARTGEFFDALADFSSALRHCSDNPTMADGSAELAPLFFNRALAYAAIGDDESSLSDLSAAVVRDSVEPRYRTGRALVMRRMGLYKAAQADYQRLLVQRELSRRQVEDAALRESMEVAEAAAAAARLELAGAAGVPTARTSDGGVEKGAGRHYNNWRAAPQQTVEPKDEAAGPAPLCIVTVKPVDQTAERSSYSSSGGARDSDDRSAVSALTAPAEGASIANAPASSPSGARRYMRSSAPAGMAAAAAAAGAAAAAAAGGGAEGQTSGLRPRTALMLAFERSPVARPRSASIAMLGTAARGGGGMGMLLEADPMRGQSFYDIADHLVATPVLCNGRVMIPTGTGTGAGTGTGTHSLNAADGGFGSGNEDKVLVPADLENYKRALGMGPKDDTFEALFCRPTPLHEALTTPPGSRLGAHVADIAAVLRGSALLAKVPAAALAAAAAVGEYRVLSRTQEAFAQGEHAAAVAIVLSGRVAVRLRRIDGHSVQLAELGPGDSFGADALAEDMRLSPPMTAAGGGHGAHAAAAAAKGQRGGNEVLGGAATSAAASAAAEDEARERMLSRPVTAPPRMGHPTMAAVVDRATAQAAADAAAAAAAKAASLKLSADSKPGRKSRSAWGSFHEEEEGQEEEGEDEGSSDGSDNTSGSAAARAVSLETYVALEPTQLLLLLRSTVRASPALADACRARLAHKYSALRRCGAFEGWGMADLSRLACMAQLQTFPANAVVLKQREQPQFLCVVARGVAKVVKCPDRAAQLGRAVAEAEAKLQHMRSKYAYHHLLRPVCASVEPTAAVAAAVASADGSRNGGDASCRPQSAPVAASPAGEVFRLSAVGTASGAANRAPPESEAGAAAAAARAAVPDDQASGSQWVEPSHVTLAEVRRHELEQHLIALKRRFAAVRREDGLLKANADSSQVTQVASLRPPRLFGEAAALQPEGGVAEGSVIAETRLEVVAVAAAALQTFEFGEPFLEAVRRRAVKYPDDLELAEAIAARRKWEAERGAVVRDVLLADGERGEKNRRLFRPAKAAASAAAG